MKSQLFTFIILFLLLGALSPIKSASSDGFSSPSLDPIDWQVNSNGLSVYQNQNLQTAGLGIGVRVKTWPSLFMNGGVNDTGWSERYYTIAGPIGVDLGLVTGSLGESAVLAGESLDWSHNQMTFTYESTGLVNLWANRLSPAIVVQNNSNLIRFFNGNVARYSLQGQGNSARVISLGDEPIFPKYIAYSNNGNLSIINLSSTATPLPLLDQNWLLVWFGSNSFFADTKVPLNYTGYDYTSFSLPAFEAYQADVPMLFVFQNNPYSVKQADSGGIEIDFTEETGNISLLPLFGRKYLDATITEGWSTALPAEVISQVNWWASHLCFYPVEVYESYAYESPTDTAIITDTFNYIPVCSGGTPIAPIPPMLGLSKDSLNISFSGPLVDGNLNTEFGPSLVIENTSSFTWRVSGLKIYTDGKRIETMTDRAPTYLSLELADQVQKIINSGHYAPWIFSDTTPNKSDFHGDVYWLNPADELYQLIEIAEALPAGEPRNSLINYIISERNNYPPEDDTKVNMPLDQGSYREDFSVYGSGTFSRITTLRPEIFMQRARLYNLYSLSRFYDLTNQPIPGAVWQTAQNILDREMREQDWATFYWFNGYQDRPVAIVNSHRNIAGMLAFVRLATLAGDLSSENLGRALFAKAAALEVGLLRYPRYLYTAGLIELPIEPDWQVQYLAGRWIGPLYNYEWSGPYDDARQVKVLDQFGITIEDHSAQLTNWDESLTASLTGYRDMVPEIARLLAETVPLDAVVYSNKVEVQFPNWYISFSEGLLGGEHNLNRPIDTFQIFFAEAWIRQTAPEKLMTFVDIPWVNEGDLFYLQKLAETIKVYNGIIWNNSLNLVGFPGNNTIYLHWNLIPNLPPETTWQIVYDGPTGFPPSPINNIPLTTSQFTISNLTNYFHYAIKLSAISGENVILTSKTVLVMPTDHMSYLPIINR